MSVLIKYMAMPKGCIYANDKDQTEYCPLLNHDDVPFCQYIENEPESAIGIDERPVYCPLSDVPEPCQDTISRQAAIDATWFEPSYTDPLNVLTEARDRLKALPPAQPEPKWISVTKRLPKIGEEVLLSEPNAMFIAEYHGSGNAEGLWVVDECHHYLADVNKCAWMPRPEPYQEGADE